MIGERERGLIEQAKKRAVFTPFLDPEAAGELRGAAKAAGVFAISNGGCEDAERVMFALSPEPLREEYEWPLCGLDIRWDKRASAPGHRDLLGSILSLGIRREMVGDIRFDAERAWACMGESVGMYVLTGLEEVGGTRVRVESAREEPPPPERGEIRVVNVASLRLDCVLAPVLKLSRAKAQELIRSGRVRLNWKECLHVDENVDEGDMLSIRGAGRVKILPTEGISRKGRLFLSVESFIDR